MVQLKLSLLSLLALPVLGATTESDDVVRQP